MSHLPYSTIIVSGDDAFDFLQAQLAADMTQLGGKPSLSDVHSDSATRVDSAEPVLSAWCNPKGRVIYLFRVSRVEGGYSLTLPTEQTEEAVKRLTMFRFRAKVEFAVRQSTPAQLGAESSYEDWQVENLRAGIPEILGAQSEQFTPHMLNLDLLGAVSLDKGCYPGQEIVARTHFRGATKRRCLRFESVQPVSPGNKVSDGDRDIGEVLNAIGNDLLAVVPVDSAGGELSVGGVPIKHIPLRY